MGTFPIPIPIPIISHHSESQVPPSNWLKLNLPLPSSASQKVCIRAPQP